LGHQVESASELAIDCINPLALDPYCRVMIRMPAALAALAAAAVAELFGAALSFPSENTMMRGVAEGLRRALLTGGMTPIRSALKTGPPLSKGYRLQSLSRCSARQPQTIAPRRRGFTALSASGNSHTRRYANPPIARTAPTTDTIIANTPRWGAASIADTRQLQSPFRSG
jgi:hypothetical protein